MPKLAKTAVKGSVNTAAPASRPAITAAAGTLAKTTVKTTANVAGKAVAGTVAGTAAGTATGVLSGGVGFLIVAGVWIADKTGVKRRVVERLPGPATQGRGRGRRKRRVLMLVALPLVILALVGVVLVTAIGGIFNGLASAANAQVATITMLVGQQNGDEVSGALGLAVAAAQAGFSGQGLRLAVAVGLAESGGDPTARNPNPPTSGCPTGSTDRGAWQLNNCYHPEVADACADNLACAARETYRISAAGSDWSSWKTYSSGAYQAQLAAADQALALAAPGGVPPGYGTPGPCGLSPATDYAKHLVPQVFGINDIGGCAFTGHVSNSDHYPDANGQGHAIDVMINSKGYNDSVLGQRVANWFVANAAALHVKYVIWSAQAIDFRVAHPAWHPCQDPNKSCARDHFNHVHISFLASF